MKYVYLIQLEGTDVYKIGFSKNPKQRVKSLQTANPYKLILVDSYLTKRANVLEKTLHRRFASYKVDENLYKLKGEFFQLDYDTVKKFQETCKKVDMNLQVIEENSTLYN